MDICKKNPKVPGCKYKDKAKMAFVLDLEDCFCFSVLDGYTKKRELRRRKKLFKRDGGLLLQQELTSRNGNVEKTKVFSSRELENDIKSSNILLDDKYKAKVSDFGTSRSATLDHTHLTTIVQGACGHLDPEYFQTHQLTDKSNVYSFGIVLVELLTGLKAITSTKAQEGKSLASYFTHTMDENRLLEILNAQIEEDAPVE
ncbi:unnamed protein product [Thlaspi arvense]|uniref:Protein kinase domain-containing protein n=1 Tax=Thlaspi arvense TaxID=13288 RepID=A0AAU9RF99_THLAR|nr:unnamed protein product [Thlaspi arvense]